jgi:hypothetical protein
MSSAAMPPNVAEALAKVMEPGEQALITFKTAWKPSFGIPTLWLSLTDRRFVLFSTLRNRNLFTSAKFSEINSVSTEHNERSIKVLFWNQETLDLQFQVDQSVSALQVQQFLDEIRSRLGPKATHPKQS